MTDRHPSTLALEAVLLDPKGAPAAAHAKECETCRARLVDMERQGDDFRQFVYPATVEALEKPRSFPWSWVLAPAGALAAAALLVLIRPAGPPSDYEGTKGSGTLKLTVYAGAGAGAVRAVGDGDAVPADASLRFRVQAAQACRLSIWTVDGTGQVSRLYPTAGDAGAPVQGLVELPGGAVLDGRAGPERLYAVCTPAEVPLSQVGSAARAAAAGGAQNVRAARSLQGLAEGSVQATLLLEKKP